LFCFVLLGVLFSNQTKTDKRATMVSEVDEFGDVTTRSLTDAELLQQQIDENQNSASFGTQSSGGTTTTGTASRTWGEWAMYRMAAPFESSITAVGVSYWLATMLSAGITSRVSV
jgi:hypothetical protein